MPAQHSPARSTTLLFIAVSLGTAIAEEGGSTDTVVVQGERLADSYVPPLAPASSRSDTPIVESPMQIQVVPAQVIEDQSAYTLKKALANVSGVAPDKNEGYALVFESAFIRGFLSQSVYLDGFPSRSHGVIPLEIAERVEVVKGPASMLYGQVAPGGFINVLTKKPQADAETSLHASYDSHGAWSAWGDTTGSLIRAGGLSGRVVAGYNDLTTFRDGSDGDRQFAAPSLAWRPSAESELISYATYVTQQQSIDDGVAFTNRGQAVVPITQNNNTPDGLPGKQMEDLQTGLQFRHDFNDQVTIRSAFQFGLFENVFDGVRILSATSATDTITRTYSNNRFEDRYYGTRNDVTLRYDTGPIQHRTMVGFDYVYANQFTELKNANLGAQSIYAPIYTLPSTIPFGTPSTSRSKSQQGSLFLQEEATWGPRKELHLLGGLRLDRYTIDVENLTPTPSRRELDQQAVTWQVGALYEVITNVGPYASYSTSFEPVPPNIQAFDGSPLDPVTGKQYELGVKAGDADSTILFTACWFHLTQEDVVITDVANPTFSINGGTIRSQGFEADVVGRLMPGLDVIGGVNHMKSEVVSSNRLPEGGRVRNVPEDSGSLWARYTLQDGRLRGLGAGLGVMTSGDKAGDDLNTFTLPGYATLNGGLYYDLRLGGVTGKAQINVNNIFDHEYYESSFNTGRVMPGQPLTVVSSLALTF